MTGHRPFSDLTATRELTAKEYVEQCLNGWLFILKSNRELGWPEQAMCVDQPARFVRQLELILQRMEAEEKG